MKPHAKSVAANFQSKISSFDCAARKTVDNIDVNYLKKNMSFYFYKSFIEILFWKPKANMDINVCFGKKIEFDLL